MIKLQVIVLCKDNVKELEFTLDSLPLDHSLLNLNYLFIDGSSTESCNLLIQERCINKFQYQYFNTLLVGVQGIYPSMNFALSKLDSDWCIFMNSGDSFHRSFQFSLFLKLINSAPSAQCIFGTCEVNSRCGFSWFMPSPKIKKIEKWCKFFEPSHQSMFVKSDLATKYDFLEQATVGADSLWKRSIINNCYFIFFNRPVSCFFLGGISSTYSFALLQKKCSEKSRRPYEKFMEIVKYMLYSFGLFTPQLQFFRSEFFAFFFR